MAAEDAAAEAAAGDEQIAGPGHVASPGSPRGHAADRRDADHKRARPGVGVASCEGQVVGGRQAGDPSLDSAAKRLSSVPWQRHGHHGRLRAGPHRRQIAEVDRKRLVADSLR